MEQPRRQRVRRHDASKVMGPGAFVVIKAITMEDAQRIEDASKPPEMQEGMTQEDWEICLEQHEAKMKSLNYEAMAITVMEWNWVDDDGQPLPQPADNPAVFAKLTAEEIEFIADRMNGNVKSKKN